VELIFKGAPATLPVLTFSEGSPGGRLSRGVFIFDEECGTLSYGKARANLTFQNKAVRSALMSN
jgi:hypothetical protein